MARKKAVDAIEQNLAETKTVRGIGDNSEKEISGEKLMGVIKTIEKIEAKKEQILQDLREEYAAVKAVGYSSKMIRRIVKERKMEPEKRKEEADLLDLYKSAIGMLDDE